MRRFLCALLLAAPAPLLAQGSGGATHLLVVSGAGGEPAFREQFHALGARLATAATAKLGIPAAQVTFLAEDSAKAPARGRSSKAGVAAALARITRETGGDDRVLIVLIGHGSWQGGAARFNLPGPDLDAPELAKLLAPFGARMVAIVNTSSASGEWVPVLAGRNRIVITATKSGMEGNATMYPRHFVEALAGDGADVDKDGAVSLLEAHEYARREVARAYEADNRLRTEHALLDDDGDGKGSAAPTGRGTEDGALARRVLLQGSGAAQVARTATDPKARALVARRDSLQRQVERLRARKEAMPAAEYERELERLLLALALANRELRAGGQP